MSDNTKQFDTWAIIELFGHTRIAGRVTEQSIGGSTFIRIDVPKTKTQEGFSRMLHPNAIYAINPVAEDVATMAAQSIKAAPIKLWDLPEGVRQIMQTRQLALDEGDADEPFE